MINSTPAKSNRSGFPFLLAITLLFWCIGFVDIVTHISGTPETAILGLYARPVFALLLAYSTLFLGWIALLIVPGSGTWLFKQIRWLQHHPPVFLLVVLGAGIGVWHLLTDDRWLEFPALRAALFALLLLLCIILIFFSEDKKRQRVQKAIGYPLLAILLVEASIQLAGLAGQMPLRTVMTGGLFVPHGRIYQNVEGSTNATSNNYGWYYPTFQQPGAHHRILLLGGTFVQGLQVPLSQHMGVLLQNRLDSARENEVLALGMPDFGPGVYLSLTRMEHAISAFEPDEIVLIVHLSNDFHLAQKPAEHDLYYTLNNGVAEIHPESWRYRHDLQHYILDGYEPVLDPLRTLRTHLMLPHLIQQMIEAPIAAADEEADPTEDDQRLRIPRWREVVVRTKPLDEKHAQILDTAIVDESGRANFLFETKGQSEDGYARAAEVMAVAESLIQLASDYAQAKNVQFRLVTIPAFPEAFFTSSADREWSELLGAYDLLLPEKKLQAFAQSRQIPFLAMGERMRQTGMSRQEIESLYFRRGRGHFTPAGHALYATSIANCFYEPDDHDKVGCYVQH